MPIRSTHGASTFWTWQTTDMPNDTGNEPSAFNEPLASSRGSLLTKYPAVIYLLPFVVYLLANSLEPSPPSKDEPGSGTALFGLIEYRHYPIVYTCKLALTIVAIAFVFPGYRQFPWRLTAWGPVAGIVGAGIWIALAEWQVERWVLNQIGFDALEAYGRRPAFNPLVELKHNAALAYGFLAIRFLGLAAIVPLIEEMFLRGFLMRFFVRNDWWNVPIGVVNRAAIAAGTIVPMLLHPGELLAAAVWFSMITWLMVKTKNIWDCVIAHAITNLLLGIYVVYFDRWQLM
jgi:CAAX prenyl protease-like protein